MWTFATPTTRFSRFLDFPVFWNLLLYGESMLGHSNPGPAGAFFWSWKCQIDQKVPKPEGLRCFYHLRHYTTLHYTTLHYTTLHHMYLSIDNTKNVLTAAGHRKLFLRVWTFFSFQTLYGLVFTEPEKRKHTCSRVSVPITNNQSKVTSHPRYIDEWRAVSKHNL